MGASSWVERGGDERVPQRVGPDSFGDPSSAGDATHDPSGGVAIESLAAGSEEDRDLATLADREVHCSSGSGRERHGHDLAALAHDGEGAMPALKPQRFDVGAGGFGDPKPIQGEQADQRVVAGAGESGRDQHRADLVAVQSGRVGLVVQTRPADMHRRGDCDEAFFFGVAVERRDGAQPSGDRGASLALGLEVAAEAFDVGAARTEDRQMPFGAPGDVLAQVERVGLTGQAAVAGQEAGQRELFLRAEQHRAYCERGGRDRSLHVGTSSIDRDTDQDPPVTRLHSVPTTLRPRLPETLPSGHHACVAQRGRSDLTGVDWSEVVSALAGRGWIRLVSAVDGRLRTELGEAVLGAPSPLPKTGSDDQGVRFGGLSSHESVAASAPVVQAFALSLADGINSAIGAETPPIPHFNHAEWATTTPDGIGFITPHRDPPTALGVVAITTLEGAARFCVWDDDATDLAPARHREEMAHQWDTGDGDVVILRCEAWPSAEARSPVHEARSPYAGRRRTLTLRHNGNGYGSDYFA